MLIISYDFSHTKTRTKFHKFLKKHGRPIQYSVFEIKNSRRILDIIKSEVDTKYKPKFTMADSIIIIPISKHDQTKIVRYGGSVQEEQPIVWFG